MAISVTEILGTDSLSGSRLVINDNFNIVASEINAIGSFFNTQGGRITNLNELRTDQLFVGISSPILNVNGSGIEIIDARIDTTGDISLNGSKLIRNDVNPQTLNDTAPGGSPIDVGSSTAVPGFTINRVGNASGGIITIQLYTGEIGQEIFFVYSDSTSTTGNVEIVGGSTPLILPGGLTKVALSAKGRTAKFLCVDNGTGNGDWYLVGGQGYTIA